MLHDKGRSTLLLGAVFVANFLETWSESRIERRFFGNSDMGIRFASAFQSLEATLTKFDFNNTFAFESFSSRFIAYSSSVAYFLLFPLVAFGIAIALARRANPIYLRCFAYTIALNYLVSLPF